MYAMDYKLAQLLYEDRLREAERKRRLLCLTLDIAGQAPIERANGLMQQIRQWLNARSQRREAADVRRPHTV